MKIYQYGCEDGLYVTQLPEDFEGQVTILHTDANGKRMRLLDAEGDGTAWTLYSTPYGHITHDGQSVDLLVLCDRMSLCVQTAGKQAYLYCRDYRGGRAERVSFFKCPQTGGIAFGRHGATVCSEHPFWNEKEAHISFDNGRAVWKTEDSRAGTYCNYAHFSQRTLQGGDSIDLFGLRILYLGETIALYDFGADVQVSAALSEVNIRRADVEETVFNRHLLPDMEKRYDRSPRLTKPEETVELRVEAPPQPQSQNEMPLIFSVGSSAFMSISSVMMAMNTVTSAQAMGLPLSSVLPSVFMAGGMFFGSLLMPIITRKYNDNKAGTREENRRRKYKAYLKQIDEQIAQIGEEQKKRLSEVYKTPEGLYEELKDDPEDLWTFMPFHKDFLILRLGTAALSPDVNVAYPTEGFTLDEDPLRDAVRSLSNNTHVRKQVPLMLSLQETGVLGILGTYRERMDYLTGLLIQLCFHHSYREMKLVFIYDKAEENEWEFARWLPHVWSDNGEFRALGTDRDAMRNISAYLESICPMSDHREKESDKMCVVVLADSYLAGQCFSYTERIRHIDKTNMRVIALSGEANDLPKECKSVVVVRGGQGTLSKDIEHMTAPVLFDLDRIPASAMHDYAQELFNTHLNDSLSDGKLVDSLSFLDMLRCGNVEQINAKERWKNSNPVKTLSVPVGIDKFGALLSLDIHQNAHGPHGLIAGMTGSGKSEFIITYLLSMAINYSPLEVGFILIDYKGGGMSDTLAGLPHTVGIIDNLGGSQGIHRALLSIKSEILRRQKVFKEICEKKRVSNLDIYKYQAMYRNGEIDEPMQHLILVSDEFAELKEQERDFMDDIVSMARIGRSLGVHLILATQKPTGVVSPQIASNARFHVCLKVQDKGDSMEMLGRPEAALLTKTGRFYLQVGFNEMFVLGQSAWSGARSEPKPRYIEEPDTFFEVVNDLGENIMKARPKTLEKADSRVKQVDEIVEYLHKTALEMNVMPQKSWKPMLPEYLLLDDIDSEYHPLYQPFHLDPVIAVVDDPQHQEQYPLQLDLTEKGNVIVYGFTGAGKQEVINAAIYSLCRHHTSEEMNIYCLDFASEACRMFNGMPAVGDVIVSGEDEKIGNFVKMMTGIMNDRRRILSSFGGSLELYRKENGAEMPNLLIIILNYAAFSEAYDQLEDDMYRLIREGNRFGIYFMITSLSATGIRYRLLQNFKQILCLQMTDAMDYVNLIGKSDGITPMERVGSGILYNGGVQLFQTGFIFPPEVQDTYQRVRAMSAKIAASSAQKKAPRVPVLPENVTIRDVRAQGEPVLLSAVPVGIDKESMMPAIYDLETNDFTFVLYNLMPEIPYFKMLGELLAGNGTRDVYMLDVGHAQGHSSAAYSVFDTPDKAKEAIDNLYDLCLARHREIKAARNEGRDVPEYTEAVIMINRLKELYDQIKDSDISTKKLDTLLKNAGAVQKMSLLIQQECRTLSQMSMRDWYARLQGHDGLWLGKGITMQSILKNDVHRESELSDQYGYIVRRGKARVIKLIEGR